LNEKSVQLSSRLAEIIGKQSGSSIVDTISASSLNIASINIIVLKSMLDILKKQGIFVTIDRPHQYVQHLLKIHKIDYSKLTFIDVISSYSGDRKKGVPGLAIPRGPFSLSDLIDLIRLTKATPQAEYLDLVKLDFLIFDNICSLLIYNTPESVMKFLDRLIGLIRETEGISIVFVVDREEHPALYEFLSSHSDLLMDIRKDLSMECSGEFPGSTETGEHIGAEMAETDRTQGRM